MGNEFGHPEWIDFPRPENGWSHHHCRRRWDLAEDDLLRYKFFQAFDELMQACECRYQWLSSSHQYVTLKSEADKVIAFERGEALFVFNFHPSNSYTDYAIGMGWNEPMRCVLDSDEGRFGGQCRLEHGHANAFPALHGVDGRPHSVKMYLPARTVQVLVKDSLIADGVKIHVSTEFLNEHSLKSTSELSLQLQVWEDATEILLEPVKVGEDGCWHFAEHPAATFRLLGPDRQELRCMASKDGLFRVYFPGEYTVSGLGYIANGSPSSLPAAIPVSSAGVDEPAPAKKAPASTERADNATKVKPEKPAAAMEAAAAVVEPPAVAKPEDDDAARPRVDMARAYSGLHFVSPEFLDALDKAEAEAAEGSEARVSHWAEAVESFGVKGGLLEVAESYKVFGLHRESDGAWTFREWVPRAQAVFLAGDFNGWDNTATPLAQQEDGSGLWSCKIEGVSFEKGSKYKLFVRPVEGSDYWVVPAWSTRYALTEGTWLLDAVYWPIEEAPVQLDPRAFDSVSDRIYECHLGLVAPREGKPAGLAEAASTLLPRVARNGYTAILLVGLLECKEYSSMGSQPAGLFAPAQKLGTPEDLVAFISAAHGLGLKVLLSIAHDGAACCEDGLPGQFFPEGEKGFHPVTGARLFNYSSNEVLRYLLASLKFWMTQYSIDGFRFQGVSSMIYEDHGMWEPTDPVALDEFLAQGNKLNNAGVHYLMMANSLVHEVCDSAVTIADEFTNFPSVCHPVKEGGLGFDMRQASALPQHLRTILRTLRDEDWGMADLVGAAMNAKMARPSDRVLGCMESSENCVVGRRPLKIAMLSWETLHTIAAGGVAPHVTELSAALHDAGHDVHIFTRSSSNWETWEHPVWGVQYHEVAFQTSGDFVQEIENMCGAFVGHLLHVEGHIGGFDIIHGHDWLVGPAISQLKAMGKRCVFTMHSTETGRCGNVAYGGQSARIRGIEGHACHAADRLIAVSGVLKEEVCWQYGIDGAKVEVIYNGIHAQPIVNMEWQDDWTGNTKRDKGFDVLAPMFLFVGRMAVQKGPDLLLDAIPMVLQARGDAKFVFVGDGHMKAELEAQAHARGFGHAVVFAGSVKSGTEHLKALFKSCDAVVVPSRNEPFGIVVLEAWAAGKPVVATTCGGPRDFVIPDQDGYLVDPNPSSIAWGICKVCENFDHCRWMGAHARDKALNEFNWAFIAQKTQTIYYQQLNLHSAPALRSRGPLLGAPLAAELLGPHRHCMGVLERSDLVERGIAMLKQIQLLTASLGSDGVLTWMGSEFGQIDSTDMPRPGNGEREFSIAYDLASNKGLKFKHLEAFSLWVNRAEAMLRWLSVPTHKVLATDEERKVLAYSRGDCVFAFNFHPVDAAIDYEIKAPSLASDLVVALDSEHARFGGPVGGAGCSGGVVKGALVLSLPPRSAVVLAPASARQQLAADPLLDRDADDLISQMDALIGA
mmetsp:Transcript_126119/g.364984  ORF Transcript_126119/g.364984 Transcript_126119/m.364984 type:complete len:1445 (-) Transcript_126119:202-4536(-)